MSDFAFGKICQKISGIFWEKSLAPLLKPALPKHLQSQARLKCLGGANGKLVSYA
jgi:hypothetical protein